MRSAGRIRRPGLALVGVLLIVGLALAAVVRSAEQGAASAVAGLTGQDRPYSVQAIVAGLAHDPHSWLGRKLWLRAVVTEPCSILASQSAYIYCARQEQPVLLDTEFVGAAVPHPQVALRLAWAGLDPLLTLVRRAPLLGRFVPPQQMVHWGTAVTYRVELRAMPAVVCGATICYEALLLDAAP